jgi:hypothetical protein
MPEGKGTRTDWVEAPKGSGRRVAPPPKRGHSAASKDDPPPVETSGGLHPPEGSCTRCSINELTERSGSRVRKRTHKHHSRTIHLWGLKSPTRAEAPAAAETARARRLRERRPRAPHTNQAELTRRTG